MDKFPIKNQKYFPIKDSNGYTSGGGMVYEQNVYFSNNNSNTSINNLSPSSTSSNFNINSTTTVIGTFFC